MKKLWIALATLAVVAAVVVAVALGGGSGATADVVFLNFKPEVAAVYQRVAERYKQETGVTVRVSTAASGTYETTLTSEIAKADAPTIFQVNGPVGLATWKDYCADLSGSGFYEALSDKSLALGADGRVLAVPYAVEGYGVIVNADLLERYFALKDRAADVASPDDIRGFAALKAVVEDMTKRKAELGIDGVFASTSLAPGNQWRWQTHLLNVPLWYEFRDAPDPTLAALDARAISFSYADGFRALFDLYLNNSVTDPALLSAKTVDDSMAELASGRCAMAQNGNWAAGQLAALEGNVAQNLRFLPLYIGAEGESGQGLCVGTENYLCVNARVSEEKQRASLDFLEWLFTSEAGMGFVRGELGFIAPFAALGGGEAPSDPLSAQVLDWTNREGVVSVPWLFAAFPSEKYKDDVGDALLEYAQGTASWDDVVRAVTSGWEAER